MTVSTSVQNTTAQTLFQRHWQNILFGLVALVLLAIAIWMRLHKLGLPFDRDSYDEGVYWQSLRAMSAGHTLYQQIFYSQPPFFLLSVFPTYLLAGQTLWGARLGIVVVSLVGLLGAFLLGKTVSGRAGAIVALLLLIIDPLYLAESQTLQAEAPSAALSFLAVGLIYMWWERPDSIMGPGCIVLSAIALALGILSKLLAVSALVPVALLVLARCWQIYLQKPEVRFASARSLIIGSVAFLLTFAVIVLPFAGSFSQFWREVVTFHTDAGNVLKSSQSSNLSTIKQALFSTSAVAITIAACYGTLVALLRRDWRVLPLLAWFLVTIIMLWRVTPLFPHHLIALSPPLISLAVMGIVPLPRVWQDKKSILTFNTLATGIGLLIVLVALVLNGQSIVQYYHTQQQAGNSAIRQDARVIQDLQAALQPDQLVVTDTQFIAALAYRNTPAALVDTSSVHINAGYLPTQQLIQEASQTQVRAVLFYSGRLQDQSDASFRTWVHQHFRLVQSYGGGKELWIKIG